MDKKEEKKAPKDTGSFEIVDDSRLASVEIEKKEQELDEKSKYYARLWMEE